MEGGGKKGLDAHGTHKEGDGGGGTRNEPAGENGKKKKDFKKRGRGTPPVVLDVSTKGKGRQASRRSKGVRILPLEKDVPRKDREGKGKKRWGTFRRLAKEEGENPDMNL